MERELEPAARATNKIFQTPDLEVANERSMSPVVTSAEVLFQPDVRTDEEVSTAHLLDLQFRFAVFAVLPGDRRDGITETADDRFQGDFYREVEVGRQEWPASVDYSSSVSFEGV